MPILLDRHYTNEISFEVSPLCIVLVSPLRIVGMVALKTGWNSQDEGSADGKRPEDSRQETNAGIRNSHRRRQSGKSF
jgi:hypothetical protein